MSHDHDSSPLSGIVAQLDRTADGDLDRNLVATTFASIDKALGGGFRRGELVVLGGNEGVGSSAPALGVAHRGTERARVLSRAMPPEHVYERGLAITA